MLWHAQGVWMAPSLRHPAGPPSGQARGAVHGAHEFRQQAGLPCSDLRVRWEVTEGPIPQISAGTEEVGLGSVVGLHQDTRARKQTLFVFFFPKIKLYAPGPSRLPPFTPMAGYACAVVCGITPLLGGSANCPAEPGGEFRAGQVTDSPRSQRGPRARRPPSGWAKTAEPTNQPYSNMQHNSANSAALRHSIAALSALH